MSGSDAETGHAMQQSGSRSTGPIRSVSVANTGSVEIHPQQVNGSRLPMMVWLIGSRRWTPPRPINAYIVDHAGGLVLFDTGQDRASVTDPGYFPGGRDRIPLQPPGPLPDRAGGDPGREARGPWIRHRGRSTRHPLPPPPGDRKRV